MSEGREWASRLEQLGLAVRRHVVGLSDSEGVDLALPVAFEGGDTVFALDRLVEPVITREIDLWPPDFKPLLLIAEGLGTDGRRLFGDADGPPRFRLIVDPIDGTRGLMYDKRSAWFLAAVARDRGDKTGLAETFAAAMVELPTSKQLWCDSYVATTQEATRGRRSKVLGDDPRPLPVRPSAASSLEFGFAQVANFFPGTKVLAAELMERIVAETLGSVQPGQGLVFDDQYLSSGGQMAELMSGHDRFCCDLRPLFHDIRENDSGKGSGRAVRGLECHPYDLAGWLAARQAGVLITDGFGDPLDCPLDVHTGVHWCGYANARIAQQVQPVIARWLQEHKISRRG